MVRAISDTVSAGASFTIRLSFASRCGIRAICLERARGALSTRGHGDGRGGHGMLTAWLRTRAAPKVPGRDAGMLSIRDIRGRLGTAKAEALHRFVHSVVRLGSFGFDPTHSEL